MAFLVTLLSALAGLFGAAGVALAAAGAHRGGGTLATTAADFLLFHAAALAAFASAAAGRRSALILLVGALLVALGTVLFSGHLALHALADLVPVPFAAPLGGTLAILGWLVVAIGLPLALRTPRTLS